MKIDERFKNLSKILADIDQAQDIQNFMLDLCTPQEIKAMSERWEICCLLHHTRLSYREIHQKTGVSLTTIGRVARFLNNESYEGYKKVLIKGE